MADDGKLHPGWAPVALALAFLAEPLVTGRYSAAPAFLHHLAFRALVVPLEWLTEGEAARLRAVLVVWALLLAGAAAAPAGRFARVVLGGTAVALVAAQLVTLGLAGLMEPSLAAGIGFGLVTCATRGVDGAGSRSGRVVAGLAGALSLYYVYALFMTRGGGYPLLEGLGDALRRGGSFEGVFLGVAGAIGLGALWLQRQDLRALVVPVGGGVLLAALFGVRTLAEDALAVAIVVPSAVLVARSVVPSLASVEGPTRWPLRMAVPCIAAGFLFGHTYSARVLACPGPEHPELRKLAEPGEAFRVVREGDLLALSLRTSQSLAAYSLRDRTLTATAPGPLVRDTSRGLGGDPEELVFDPKRGAWYASMTPRDRAPWVGFEHAGSSLNNLLVRTDARLRAVEDAFFVPDLCWINTMRWGVADDLLYLGCEERAGLHRWHPDRGVVDAQEDPLLGDVQDIAFGEGDLQDRLWTISLWRSPSLTTLKRDDLSLLGQATIGGTHYHLAHDPTEQRLYASAYYGGRIDVVDARTSARLEALPASFGVREVVVHDRLRLLLASGTYDGKLRIWTLAERAPRTVAKLPVGGHVKDIAIAEDDDKAYFWSQCGLYELDLAKVERERGPRG